jgi:hypothetical protein
VWYLNIISCSIMFHSFSSVFIIIWRVFTKTIVIPRVNKENVLS